MKKILLFFIVGFISLNSFGQNPDLFQTWYLSSYSTDLGSTYYLTDVEPFLSIDLTIDSALSFSGAACNEYVGAYSYDATDDVLVLDFFDLCLCGACNNPPQSHVDLENIYFSYYFSMEGQPYEYEVWTDPTTGVMGLRLESIPGFVLEYQNIPVLGISEQPIYNFAISPNPVTDVLTISSESNSVLNISIYNLSGQLVYSENSNNQNLDVSRLKVGLYFIEVTSQNGKSVKRFIKE